MDKHEPLPFLFVVVVLLLLIRRRYRQGPPR